MRKQLEIVEISVRVLRSKINTTSVAISLEAEADQESGEGEEGQGGGADHSDRLHAVHKGRVRTRVVTGQTLEYSLSSCACLMTL